MLAAAVLMWGLDALLPVARLWDGPVGWIGAVPAAAGVAIAASAVLRFRRAGTTADPRDPTRTSRLVTDGVFAFSRNPMYLSLTLLLAGWACRLGSVSPWAVLPAFVAVLTQLQIRSEELALSALFGQDYIDYCQRVGRWFGRGHFTD
jgi:protein-S-isoprenylcysteine O-methyltransferase Ste14